MTITDALAELRSIGCPAHVWRGNPRRGHVDRFYAGRASHGLRNGDDVPDAFVWYAVREWVRGRRQWRDVATEVRWKAPEDAWRANVRYARSRYR